MKCRACQNELLVTADPAQPSPEAAEHLAGCPACREWQRQLLRIERNVARIPVAPSRTKESFIRRLAQDAALPAPPPTLPLPARRWPLSAVGAAGLVAAGLLIACGIFLGNFLARSLQSPGPSEQAGASQKAGPTSRESPAPRKGPAGQTARENKAQPAPPVASPLLARLLACDLTLAEAKTPHQRFEALASLAEELQGETRALAQEAGAEDLRALARLYEKVVQDGIVAQGRRLPAGQRRAILGPIATRLVRTRRDLRELASRSGPGSSGALLQIAAAADAGGQSLRQLLREETP
jgi:hypothetical protein